MTELSKRLTEKAAKEQAYLQRLIDAQYWIPDRPGIEQSIADLKAAAEAVDALAAAREREAGLLAHIDQQQWALKEARPILEAIDNDGEYIPPRGFNDALNAETLVSEMDPPAALDDLRRRERSIGAEEELRRIVYELVGSHSWPSGTTITAGELDARADAIAAERDHFADSGKKVNHPGIPESSGGAR